MHGVTMKFTVGLLILDFYTIVAQPNNGCSCWLKQVTVNVMNKWIYNNLYCRIIQGINKPMPIKQINGMMLPKHTYSMISMFQNVLKF